MILGLINEGEAIVLDDSERRIELANFTIGLGCSDLPLRILHSAAATPGRYLAEICRRLKRFHASTTIAVCNPFLAFSSSELGLLAHRLLNTPLGSNGLLIEDRQGVPVAVYLPRRMAERHIRFLSLMSCVDAELDAQLLAALFGTPPSRLKLSCSFRSGTGADAFYCAPAMLGIYRWVTQRAIDAILASGSDAGQDVRFAAILPFNAGDVLFTALALRHARGFCRALVVDRRYAAIAAESVPGLELIEIDLRPRIVDGIADWELALFERIEAGLPEGFAYSYCRPSRRYDRRPVHLIDQYAFGVGDDCLGGSFRDAQAPLPPQYGRRDRSVLLHFDGGWPMKIYPPRLQSALVSQLLAAGYEVTVLSDREGECGTGVRHVRYSSLDNLKSLILSSDIIVGMDSFPAHYAAHLLGTPTLCLFASTQPANSDARASGRYRALHQGLACTPCGGFLRCPSYGGAECRNFLSPQAVCEAVVAMWHEVYGEAR
jgi:hypothetical protein